MSQDPQTPGDTPPPSGWQGAGQPPPPGPSEGTPGSATPPPAYPPPPAEGYPPPGEYPPPGSSQPGYGQEYAPTAYPYYGAPTAPTAPPTDDKAVWALVTSIAGWIICPIILHIVGWVLANQSLATIRASGGTVGGEGMAKAARILSIVGLALWGVVILFGVLFAVIGLIAAVDSGEFAQIVGSA